MQTLPCEIFELIVARLDARDAVSACNARLVPLPREVAYRYARDSLVMPSRETLRRACCQCEEDALTHILWSDGNVRSYVPWCMLHIDPQILHQVELYCFKGATRPLSR